MVQPERGKRGGVFRGVSSLQINGGTLSVGRAEIAAAAQAFMTAFPDMIVSLDGVSLRERDAIFKWTLTGTNTGLGGTGRPVRQWLRGVEVRRERSD